MIPVLSYVCREGNREYLRRVYPLDLTIENLGKFWDKARNFRTLFTDDIDGDFKKFCEVFLSSTEDYSKIWANGLLWVIDDFVGIYYMTHITSGDAKVHFTFFDGKLQGREELTMEMLKYVFVRYNFRRLTCEIPRYASHHVSAFVERIGFVREGGRRKAALYKGDWYDVKCYGILAEEAITWASRQKKSAEDQPQDSQTTLLDSSSKVSIPDLLAQ